MKKNNTVFQFNWGTGIMLLYSCFVIGIMFMVYKSVNQKVDLVSEDYYTKELAFQNQIEATGNATAQGESVLMQQNGSNLIFSFPASQVKNNLSGTIYFYKPDNEFADIHVPIKLKTNESMLIPTEVLKMGLWKIEISWTAAGKNYFKTYQYIKK